MSILRPIIRVVTVAALRDRTWCENRVYDSDQTPLAEAVLGTAAKPYMVVYTDMDDIPSVNGYNQLYSGDGRRMNIALEIGVASAVREEATNQLVIQFAATDEGMELAVDIIESQCLDALLGDAGSPWGQLFRKMVQVRRVQSRRGGQAERGVRWAARRVTLVCETLHDIPPGVGVNDRPLVKAFIEMCRASPQLGVVDCATIVEDFLTNRHAPEWRVAQGFLGVSDEGAEALMLPGIPAFRDRTTNGESTESASVLNKLDLEDGDPLTVEPLPVDPSWVGIIPIKSNPDDQSDL